MPDDCTNCIQNIGCRWTYTLMKQTLIERPAVESL